MIATHAMRLSGQIWCDLAHGDDGNLQEIQRLIAGLDGVRRYSIVLSRLPAGRGLGQIEDPDQDMPECIQCAGRADRLSVEVRRHSGSSYEHFVVGHPLGQGAPASELIEWSDYQLVVCPNEVFDASEAFRLFRAYYETGWVPSHQSLRKLNF